MIPQKPASLADAIDELGFASWAIVSAIDNPGKTNAAFELAKINLEAIYELTKAPPNLPGKDSGAWAVELRQVADNILATMDAASIVLSASWGLPKDADRYVRIRANAAVRQAEDMLRDAIDPLKAKLYDLRLCDGIGPEPVLTTPPVVEAVKIDKTSTKKTKGKNIDGQMAEILLKNQDCLMWSAEDWGKRLKCAPSTAFDTPTFKKIMNMRAMVTVETELEGKPDRRRYHRKKKSDSE